MILNQKENFSLSNPVSYFQIFYCFKRNYKNNNKITYSVTKTLISCTCKFANARFVIQIVIVSLKMSKRKIKYDLNDIGLLYANLLNASRFFITGKKLDVRK